MTFLDIQGKGELTAPVVGDLGGKTADVGQRGVTRILHEGADIGPLVAGDLLAILVHAI